jgi:hypothetical protein
MREHDGLAAHQQGQTTTTTLFTFITAHGSEMFMLLDNSAYH